jgi:quercetin dioxygenase-like cupin family protein
VGPLHLPRAPEYTASYAYAVMRPGQRSRVHIHPGPEAWYLLSGEQCLETSVGTFRGRAGETVIAPAKVPMELTVTGTETRRALVLVVHDGREQQAKAVDWQPKGVCTAR